MTLLTVIECLNLAEKIYRAKTTSTARTAAKIEVAYRILEFNIFGSKKLTSVFKKFITTQW